MANGDHGWGLSEFSDFLSYLACLENDSETSHWNLGVLLVFEEQRKKKPEKKQNSVHQSGGPRR